VRVPPFIQVTVTLTSADGDDYTVDFGDQRVSVGPNRKRATTVLDGLRQGASYTGRVQGGGSVTIEASAEPGP
jgi:hypothetical protein